MANAPFVPDVRPIKPPSAEELHADVKLYMNTFAVLCALTAALVVSFIESLAQDSPFWWRWINILALLVLTFITVMVKTRLKISIDEYNQLSFVEKVALFRTLDAKLDAKKGRLTRDELQATLAAIDRALEQAQQ